MHPEKDSISIGTCVVLTPLVVESAWSQPNDFIPERWYSRPELIKDKRAYAPFSFGARHCLGKSMGFDEMRLSVSMLLRNYDVSFAPDYDEDTMWRDLKDQVTSQPGKLLCVFTPRESRK
jgi:cytochrome P450